MADEGFAGNRRARRFARRDPHRARRAGRARGGRRESRGTRSWRDAVAEGLAGIECLSGIPGATGATPIQNVGAYGQEVADTISRVRVYDRETASVSDLTPAECGFAYR